jgi:outer membrane protein OmpA-like peptidoglycan-associated protein
MSRGVPESSIVSTGKGSSDPIVGCEGMRGAALIECLAPNRRTEIDFSAVEIIEENAGEVIEDVPTAK